MEEIPEFLLLSAALIGAGFLVFGIIVRRDYAKRGRLTAWSASLEFIVFITLNCAAYRSMPADWPRIHSGAVLSACGGLIALAGLVITGLSIFQLGFSYSLGRESKSLRQAGLYRISRNPQIIGYVAFITGAALLWPSRYAPFWLAQTAAVAHIMILTEEEYLRGVYGAAYETYCGRTPRYLGVGTLRPRRKEDADWPVSRNR